MPAKSFQNVTYASAITFDADLSKNYQVTLTGSPTITLAGGREGDEITILFIQGGSGGYNPTWPSSVSWFSGQKPNMNSTVGAMDLVTLVKRGSTWQDKDGAPSKLPSRLASAALATMTVVNVVATTLNLSAGAGTPSEIGAVEDVNRQYVGTGSDKTMVRRDTGSGDLLLSASGANATGLGVGVPNLKTTSKITDANLYVNAQGELTGSSATLRGTMSGGKLVINAPEAGTGTAIVQGSSGGRICMPNTSGTMYVLVITGGKLQTRLPVASECDQ